MSHTARKPLYSHRDGFSTPGVYSHARRYLSPVLMGRARYSGTIDGHGSSNTAYEHQHR